MNNPLKRYLQAAYQPAWPSAALLLLRLIVGAAFVIHGWGKIQTPMSWMPAQAPVHVPGFFQLLAAVSEFGGGIALILGLLTPLAMLGLISTMAVAVYMQIAVFKAPFVSSSGASSYELALVYLGVALIFLAIGPGKYSLDRLLFGERR